MEWKDYNPDFLFCLWVTKSEKYSDLSHKILPTWNNLLTKYRLYDIAEEYRHMAENRLDFLLKTNC